MLPKEYWGKEIWVTLNGKLCLVTIDQVKPLKPTTQILEKEDSLLQDN